MQRIGTWYQSLQSLSQTKVVDMKKQILSAVIALPLVLTSAASSFANNTVRIAQVKTPPTAVDTLKPAPSNILERAVSKPVTQNSNLGNSLQITGEDPTAPGGSFKPQPLPQPKPPRTDLIFQNPGTIVEPGLNSIPQNQNINGAVGH